MSRLARESAAASRKAIVINKDCQIHYHKFMEEDLCEDCTGNHAISERVITLVVNTKDTYEADKLRVGVAISHANEPFNRKMGRTIAMGRAFTPKTNRRGQYLLPKSVLGADGEISWDKVEEALFLEVETSIDVDCSQTDAILYLAFTPQEAVETE